MAAHLKRTLKHFLDVVQVSWPKFILENERLPWRREAFCPILGLELLKIVTYLREEYLYKKFSIRFTDSRE
jgi:hypothetical protein